MNQAYIIGVAGGSCSGKTTLVRKAHQILGEEDCSVLFQDSYYIDQSDFFDRDGGSVNFDHPSSIDFSLLAKHLQELKSGKKIEVPIYDFSTHKRQSEYQPYVSKKVIFLDGILILTQPQIVSLLDLSLFIECEESLRLERRIQRDVRERGRTKEGVMVQFANQVSPMHKKYVDPSKVNAHKVIPQAQLNNTLTQIVDICTAL